MKKKIIIFFIVFVVIFTFLGASLFFNVSPGDLFIGYPQLFIKNISSSPNGNSYNMRAIGNEIVADLSTIFAVGAVRTITLLTNDSNNQIRLQDCESTLDKAIYMVQSSIRYSQGTYPDPYYDAARTLYDYYSIFLYPLESHLSNGSTQILNIYHLPYNFLNVYFNTDYWSYNYGYTITRSTNEFRIEVFDGEYTNTISDGLYKSISYDSYARGGSDRLSIYYPVAECESAANTYIEFIRTGNIPSITYKLNGDLIHLTDSFTATYIPYGEIETYYIAF